eukprot:scaffold288635_cov60-Attheya_sp.AAC.4
MAKKKSNKNKGTKSKPSVVHNTNQQHLRAVESLAELKYALRTCSFDRLRAIYLDLWPMIKHQPKKERRVTDAAMDADPVTTRAIMEVQLGALPVAERPLTYRNQIKNQLQSMGGMKITACSGEGKERLCAFAYTCGFTGVGGRELLLQNVHRSMLSPSIVGSLFNYLYKQHNDGHPLFHGSTIQVGDLAYTVETPAGVEATLIKASKTLEPTRLYGLAGYNILLIIPVGTRSADAHDENRATNHAEVIALARGCAPDDGGFRPEPNAAKLRICAWCKKSMAALENKQLKKCSGCNASFYCSREHQKLHWKRHKIDCMRSKEESFKMAMGLSDATGTALETGANQTDDDSLSDEDRRVCQLQLQLLDSLSLEAGEAHQTDDGLYVPSSLLDSFDSLSLEGAHQTGGLSDLSDEE